MNAHMWAQMCWSKLWTRSRGCTPPPLKMPIIKNSMFEQLLDIFPKGVARVILDYEGRIYEANLRDLVTNVYICDYQRVMGRRVRLIDIVNAVPLLKLEWFANFAKVLIATNPACLKLRRSKVHKSPFVKDCKLFAYTVPKTRFSVRNVHTMMTRPTHFA